MQPDLNLAETYDFFIAELSKSVQDRTHGFHIIQFGTISQNGPEIRSVVLRRVEQNPLRIYFHTHIESPKIIEIQKNLNTAVHAYCGNCRKQIRFKGNSIILTDGAIYDDQTKNLTASASRCYLTPFAPSSHLETYHPNIIDEYLHRAPTLQEKKSSYPNMAVIEFTPIEIDALWLRSIGHIRIGGFYNNSEVKLSWLAP